MISCLESVKLDWDGMRKGCIRKDWYASLKRVSIVQIVVLKTEALYLCAWHVFLFVFVFNQLSNTFSLFLIYNTVASFFFFFVGNVISSVQVVLLGVPLILTYFFENWPIILPYQMVINDWTESGHMNKWANQEPSLGF